MTFPRLGKPNSEDAVELERLAAAKLRDGQSATEVLAWLAQHGLSPSMASAVVDKLVDADYGHIEVRHRAPFAPGRLIDLLFRPSKFFVYARNSDYAWLLVAAWLAGMARAIGRIESVMMRADLGGKANAILSIGLAESWVTFWIVVVISGAAGAVFLWFVGAWWYRVRLRFSGAAADNKERVRRAYFYSVLVEAVPSILFAVAATILYSGYEEYWNSDQIWSTVLLIFPFWACVVSYKAARTMFAVSRWKARVWFLALPITVNVFAFGVIGLLYYMITEV